MAVAITHERHRRPALDQAANTVMPLASIAYTSTCASTTHRVLAQVFKPQLRRDRNYDPPERCVGLTVAGSSVLLSLNGEVTDAQSTQSFGDRFDTTLGQPVALD